MTNSVGNGIVKRKKGEQETNPTYVGYAGVSTVEQNLQRADRGTEAGRRCRCPVARREGVSVRQDSRTIDNHDVAR